MFFLRKDSLINNFMKYQNKIYKNSLSAISKSKRKNNIYYLNKKAFIKTYPNFKNFLSVNNENNTLKNFCDFLFN